MIKSMTGYGRGETLLDGRKVMIEIRSTNHRFCDIWHVQNQSEM
jgi:uncharacterized protein YicC (UPF0701 family)